MSGHSKWAQIKRKKGVADTKRGQLFTRLGREIAIAARHGGGDPEANFVLRLAVDKAKANNMPKENIERAIHRGTGGDKEGGGLEEIMYEGYGPGGSALLVQVLTDNRNRAASDIRRLFSRLGGNLAAANAVAWLFEKKGVISVETDGQNADDVELQVIDAGAEDFRQDGNLIEVTTAPGDLKTVRDALEKMHVKIDSAELAWVPKNLARIGEAETEQSMHLIDTLEELDDVQKVYSNLDISEAVLARFEAAKEGA